MAKTMEKNGRDRTSWCQMSPFFGPWNWDTISRGPSQSNRSSAGMRNTALRSPKNYSNAQKEIKKYHPKTVEPSGKLPPVGP